MSIDPKHEAPLQPHRAAEPRRDAIVAAAEAWLVERRFYEGQGWADPPTEAEAALIAAVRK